MNHKRPLRKTFNGPGDLIKGDLKISSPPAVYFLLNEIMKNPHSSIIDIAKVISGDQGLTVRLLKLANSAMYGFYSRIESVPQSISMLGTKQISDLVLSTTVMQLFEGISKDIVDLQSFWRHSLGCGLIARIIATYRREPNVERFFTAGILHDVGRLIFYMKIPELSRELLLENREGTDFMHNIEMRSMGFTHAEVGGLLLKEWKLPLSLEEMVRFHHQPLLAMRFPVDTAIVHIADIISHAMQLGTSGERFVPVMEVKAWESIGIRKSLLSSIIKQADLQFADVSRMFEGNG